MDQVGEEAKTQELLKRLGSDEIYFLETFLRIVDTEGHLVPFRLKNRPMQMDFVNRVLKEGRQKVIELKARRVGGTSLFMALGLVRCHLKTNYSVLLIAQSDPDAKAFMKKGFKKFYADMHERVMLPDGSFFAPKLDLGVDSDSEMYFPETGSWIVTATAGSAKFGRGQGFDMIIGTEVSRWEVGRTPGTAEETWSMAQGAVGDKTHTLMVQESTAYGAAGFYYETYRKAKDGENGYLPLFYDWKWHPNYRMVEGAMEAKESCRGPLELDGTELALGLDPEQARWRRTQIADLGLPMFLQEFPEDDETCFRVSGDPYFNVEFVDLQLKGCRPAISLAEGGELAYWQFARVGEKYIVACDPGGEGVERRFASQERDYDVLKVFDSRLSEVARFRGRTDAYSLGALAVKLCKEYNDAIFASESGPYGESVLLVVSTVLGYDNIYFEKDDDGRPKSPGKRVTESSKPAMLENLRDVVEHGLLRSDDREFWKELRNFHRVPTPTGRIKLEARAGHDDTVMAASLAAWVWREADFGNKSRYKTKVFIPRR